ncbi:MAG: 16S rRNA (guanine(966)-N(2))-methyltransferase RsmD [Propionibacteriaceae bacterium]
MTRIISGRFGGQRLATPATDKTRPTSDRVREAFFASLVSWAGTVDEALPLTGMTFLDLYAGSGAMGLEALSRGAERATLVESSRPTAAVIRRNVATLGVSAQVVLSTVTSFLTTTDAHYDIVWFDPPYAVASADIDAELALVVERNIVVRNGLVVVERSSRSEAPCFPAPFTDSWARRYGETTIYCAQIGDECE